MFLFWKVDVSTSQTALFYRTCLRSTARYRPSGISVKSEIIIEPKARRALFACASVDESGDIIIRR